MKKAILSKKDVRAARIQLLKMYGLPMLMVSSVCLVVLVRGIIALCNIFTYNAVATFFVLFLAICMTCLSMDKERIEWIKDKYQDWKLRRNIRTIIREEYGYATDENINAINTVVSIVVQFSSKKKFRKTSKEFYNLMALSPSELAVLYGAGYFRLGKYQIRLPLPA